MILNNINGIKKKEIFQYDDEGDIVARAVIDEVLKSDDNKTFTMSVSEFKALFSTAQLNRGWTKPQLEEIFERLK